MQDRTCTIDGCDKPYRARGLCASHWNAAYRKDQHREVPCAVCGTMVVKNAPGIKRRSVCSDRCRAELRRDASPPKPSVPFDRVAHARAQRSAIRAALEDGDDAALLKAILTDCVETPDGCWQWLRSSSPADSTSYIAWHWKLRHSDNSEANRRTTSAPTPPALTWLTYSQLRIARTRPR